MATANETMKMIITAEDRTRGIFSRLNLSIGGFLATVAGLVAMTKQLANAGDELGKFSRRTGIAVEELSALKLAGELNDVSLGDLETGFRQLQKNLGDALMGLGQAKRGFDLLGFSTDDLKKGLKDPVAILELMAKRLFEVDDAGRRTQIAMTIMGRSGTQLLPLLEDLSNRGIKGLREESDALGVTWSKDMAEAAEKFNDALGRAGNVMEGLKLRFIGPLIEAFVKLSDKMGLGGPGAQNIARLESSIALMDRSIESVEQKLERLSGATNSFFDSRRASLQSQIRDLQSEREDLEDQLERLKAPPGAARSSSVFSPKAVAITEKIGQNLGLIQQRVTGFIEKSLIPSNREFEKMFQTINRSEAQAFKVFGGRIPAELATTISKTKEFVRELAKASGINPAQFFKDLPPLILALEQSARGTTTAIFQLAEGIKGSEPSFSNIVGTLRIIEEEGKKIITNFRPLPETFNLLKDSTHAWLFNIERANEKLNVFGETAGGFVIEEVEKTGKAIEVNINAKLVRTKNLVREVNAEAKKGFLGGQ